ncbi:unnamed protein product [Leptidea sinapis]|uniref:Uncharacterized protein n=1 Tax=Leptidea sinapis TaxID=189913 RepID=A0A5E4QWW9_9NEOP|nr:unnamed protein product [Leptidea sinapis]
MLEQPYHFFFSKDLYKSVFKANAADVTDDIVIATSHDDYYSDCDYSDEGKGFVSSSHSPEQLADQLFEAFYYDITGLDALQALALSGQGIELAKKLSKKRRLVIQKRRSGKNKKSMKSKLRRGHGKRHRQSRHKSNRQGTKRRRLAKNRKGKRTEESGERIESLAEYFNNVILAQEKGSTTAMPPSFDDVGNLNKNSVEVVVETVSEINEEIKENIDKGSAEDENDGDKGT